MNLIDFRVFKKVICCLYHSGTGRHYTVNSYTNSVKGFRNYDNEKNEDDKYDNINKNNLRLILVPKYPINNTISYDSITGRGSKISRETGSQF